MTKIIVLAMLAALALNQVNANEVDDLFEIFDTIISPLLPIGIPEQPLVEDGEKVKKLCSLLNKDFINKQKHNAGSFLKGIAAKLVQNALDNFSADKFLICKFANEGQLEKASFIAKEYNKQVLKMNKLRLSLLSAFHELTQTGTKASLPKLSCYLKKFVEKTVDTYPEENGIKDFIKSVFSEIWGNLFVKIIESESGKAADICPLPEANTNKTKYNSLFVALFHTLITLQDK